MACGRRMMVDMRSAAAAAILVVVICMGKAHCQSFECPKKDYAYPYWSHCQTPARYGEEYHLVSAAVAASGGLEPEWDEANSTYYVRFTGSRDALGAKYAVKKLTSDKDANVALGIVALINNTESGRALSWRSEGADDFFLTESHSASVFILKRAEPQINLPCPLLLNVRCEAYYLLFHRDAGPVAPLSGLLAHPEDGVTYIRAAPQDSSGDLPLLILRVVTDDAPSNILASVVAS